MTVLMAFLHHAAAFVLFSALVVQLATLKDEPTLASARRLQRYDMIYGSAASVLLVAGLLRVFYFEKGAAYYWSNTAFIAKFACFILIGLLSIYPTATFLSWRRSIAAGQAPQISEGARRLLRQVIHTELTLAMLMMALAAMMARGVGA